MASESATLKRHAKRLGYELDTGSGHLKISRNGGPVVTVAGSPSTRDFTRTTAVVLRQHGYGDLAEAIRARPPKKTEQPRTEATTMAKRAPRTAPKPPLKVAPDPKELRAELELIDADRARQLLAGNVANRNVRPDYVATLARQFVTGDFLSAVGSVVVSDEGVLLDGQHRLHALVAADMRKPGVTWLAVCVYGLDRSVITVVDQGRPRTFGDVLAIERGVRQAPALAGVTGTLYRLINRHTSSTGHYQRMKPTSTEALRLFDEHADAIIRAHQKVARSVNTKKLLGVPTGAALLVAFSMVDEAEAKDFFDAINQPTSSLPQALVLREHLLSVRDKARPGSHRVRMEPVDKMRWAVLAWNAWRQGRTLTNAALRRGEGVPNIDGFNYPTDDPADRLRSLVDED